jgi:thiol-disulfide isomerase/thioredoxin
MGKTSLMVLVLLGALTGGPLQLRAQARTLPLFEIKLASGESLKSSDLKGKVAVIDFWGTWCKPCLVEIPEYNALFRDYSGKGLVFLAVAVESGTDKELAAAAKRLRIEYPVAPATAEQLDAFGQVLVFPTTWVFDREGKLVKEFLGTPAMKHTELRSLVGSLLAAP